MALDDVLQWMSDGADDSVVDERIDAIWSLPSHERVLIHGTSAYAARHMLDGGYLPTADARRDCRNKDYLYFMAMPDAFGEHPLGPLLLGDEEEQRCAITGYARLLAMHHHLFQRLPCSLTGDVDVGGAQVLQHCLEKTLPAVYRPRAKAWAKETDLYHGVILTFGSSIFELPIEPDEDPEQFEELNAVKILLPHGLPREHVTGIYPLSEHDAALLYRPLPGRWK